MNGYRQISPGQWFFISLFSTICLTPFGFPTTLYRFLGHGAWVPIVAAYLLTLWSMYVSLRICESKGIDFLGIGERFRQKNWNTSKWKDRLKELDINIHVDAKVLSGKGSQ